MGFLWGFMRYLGFSTDRNEVELVGGWHGLGKWEEFENEQRREIYISIH